MFLLSKVVSCDERDCGEEENERVVEALHINYAIYRLVSADLG